MLDVSSLARWSGPPVGIARVEHALATAVMRRPDAVLAFYDRATGSFRALRPEWQATVVGWSGLVEIPDDDPPRRGWRALLPGRKPAVTRLERWRLTWPRPLAALADAAQRAILAVRSHGTPLRDASGQRIARVPPDLAIGEVLRLSPADVVFAAGSGWTHLDMTALGRMKARDGFRFATLCYDLIPLTHPRFWFPKTVEVVRAHWLAALPLADLVVVNARCIAEDVRRFSAENGIVPPDTAVLPLGYDPPPRRAATAPLPSGLAAGRYALFVSTIEPRKGHATLLQAWRGLLARGLPQRNGFRLVFVGREGWMVEDVLRELAEPALAGSVLHLTGIGEAALDTLYEGAAFILYPSAYEGFGLPIIEAFARGKAVIASAGGAVPETAGGLAPCLPPGDAAAWEAVMADWIENPGVRKSWEACIRIAFTHPDWETAANGILDAVASAGSAQGRAKPQ
ncbi:glycosyltransferase family 4 protein [Muricoccus radiodurans]|uniref:glycosyltransferase family 4 protein n=1 Tax=Muricoccus radiodurans TaxID=2231721 RepID=UPI003CF2E887